MFGYIRKITEERTYVAITTPEYDGLQAGYSSHNITTVNKTAAYNKYTILWVRHVHLVGKYPPMTFVSPWVTHDAQEFSLILEEIILLGSAHRVNLFCTISTV